MMVHVLNERSQHTLVQPTVWHKRFVVIVWLFVVRNPTGLNFLAFVRMANTGAPFLRLTCNSGYFFKILYFSRLWRWKTFYLFWGGGGEGVVDTSVEIKCPTFEVENFNPKGCSIVEGKFKQNYKKCKGNSNNIWTKLERNFNKIWTFEWN